MAFVPGSIANTFGTTPSTPSEGAKGGFVPGSIAATFGTQPTAPVATPSNFATDWLGIKNPDTYVQDSTKQITDFSENPGMAIGNAVNAGFGAVSGAIKGAIDSTGKAFSDFGTPTSVPQTTADVLHAVVSDVSAFPPFLAINAAYSAAQQLPALKQAADVLNAPFTVIGKIGSLATGTFVDVLPVDQATKDTLKPAFEEVGSLAAQIILGGKITHMVFKGAMIDKPALDQAVADSKKEAGNAQQQVADHQANQLTTEVGTTKPFDQNAPAEQSLATADKIPVTSTDAAPTGNAVENSTTPQNMAQTVGNTSVENSTTPNENSTNGNKTSGVAERIQADAVEKGLVKNGYTEMAQYEGTTDATQARAIADLYNSGIDKVIETLKGTRDLPPELRPGALVTYTKDFIKENADHPKAAELAHALVNSKHTGAFSQAGSDLRAGKGFADSVAGRAEEIKKAHEVRAGEKAVARAKALPKEAKDVMGKMNLGPEDLGKLQSFIDKITCG